MLLKNRRKILTITIALIIIISVASVVYFSTRSNDIAYINHTPISKREFEILLENNKTKIISEFHCDNVKMQDVTFWHTAVNGKSPAESLCEKTLQDCIRSKSIQMLACKYEILTNCSYDTFLKTLSAENQTRRQNLLQHEPVYGPNQYTEKNFYEHYILNISLEIQKKMAEQSCVENDNIYKQYFEEIKDQYFKREDSIEILIMDIPEGVSYHTTQEYYYSIQLLISQNKPIDNQLRQFNINSRTILLDENSIRYYSIQNPVIIDRASTLQHHELSDIFTIKNHYCILFCLNKKAGGYYNYESVADVVKAKFYKKQFEILLQNQMNDQQVKTTRLYDSYKINYKGGGQ